MRAPDEELPQKQVTLQEFLQIADGLLYNQQDVFQFVRFMLAGRYTGDGAMARAFVNVKQGLHTGLPDNEVTVTRDYDSIIGISQDLPYMSALAVFPLAPFKETLKKNNHMKSLAFDSRVSKSIHAGQPIALTFSSQGDRKQVPCHKVPNFALGKVITRHVVRVCLPHMYLENAVVPIRSDLMARIYNEALKPTVDEVTPNTKGRWPMSYDSAMMGARDKRTGQLRFGSIDIDAPRLPRFARKFLAKLRNIAGCEDAYFLHEIRGIKGAGEHDPTDREARWDCLNHVLENVDRGVLKQDEWMVDVALEYSKRGHVMQWLIQGHLALLRALLPSVPTDVQLQRIMDRPGFSLDRAAQLGDLAGFRLVVPSSAARADNIVYVNVYPTDKSQTYALHPTCFRNHSAEELIGKALAKLQDDVKEMSAIYAGARGRWGEADSGSPGNARIEIRVPLAGAGDVLQGLPANVVAASIVAVPTWTWW